MFYKIKYNTVLAEKSLARVVIPSDKTNNRTQKQTLSAIITTIEEKKILDLAINNKNGIAKRKDYYISINNENEWI